MVHATDSAIGKGRSIEAGRSYHRQIVFLDIAWPFALAPHYNGWLATPFRRVGELEFGAAALGSRWNTRNDSGTNASPRTFLKTAMREAQRLDDLGPRS